MPSAHLDAAEVEAETLTQPFAYSTMSLWVDETAEAVERLVAVWSQPREEAEEKVLHCLLQSFACAVQSSVPSLS